MNSPITKIYATAANRLALRRFERTTAFFSSETQTESSAFLQKYSLRTVKMVRTIKATTVIIANTTNALIIIFFSMANKRNGCLSEERRRHLLLVQKEIVNDVVG